MRYRSVFDRGQGERDVTMTPMIDVVFLLLVFFIWTASFQVVEMSLPSSVSSIAGTEVTPDTAPPPEDDFDDVVIRIIWQGTSPMWQMNQIQVSSLKELRDRLSTIAKIKIDSRVILHPDPSVPLGDVIDVYDSARLIGFKKIHFAASEEI